MSVQRFALLGAFTLALFAPTQALATLTATPLTWNVIGLDSNRPVTGPTHFPVGARVCSKAVAATNISVNWVWDSTNANINLRPGSLSSITFASLAPGACADAYFEVEVTPVPAAFDTARRYHITATDGSSSASTPTPRELYVEHLISQNRNAVTGAKLDGVSVPAGGSMNLVVGNTYTIELDGGTATQGYNQFEGFFNFPNTIFRILSVSTTYSTDDSPYVPGPAPIASDKLYADACLWDSDPASVNYLSCVGGDFKAGGNDVRTTYTVLIVGGGGTSQTLSGLLYDFSGSSFHYNANFSTTTWIANIVDPAAIGFTKAFAPASTVAGGTSTLTFTLTNPSTAVVSGANFTDPLPILSGSQMVVAAPATFSTSGCGAPTFQPAAGATSVSFSNGTIGANGTCVVSVRVSVPATPTTGTYVNTSNHLLIGGLDTGHSATANLALATSAPGTNLCGLPLAQWTMPTSAGTAVPPAFSFKASDVAVALAAAGSGISSSIETLIGNPVNSWSANGFSTAASLTLSNNDFFQFAVTTTNFTNLAFTFDARLDNNLHGPASLQLASSTDGSNFALYGAVISPGATFVTYNPSFPGPANTGGLTYFRIYGYNAQNSGVDAKLFIDNVTITGCQPALPPTIAKKFLSDPVGVGGTSTLLFTLTNPNTAPLTGVKFSDSLPAGLQVATTPAATTTCTGSPSWSPSAGSTTLDFGQTTGAGIPASSSCSVSVNVTDTTAGPHVNVSGFISSTESGTNTGTGGSAAATLTAILPPVIVKSFGTDPILPSGTSLLTFTITNPNQNNALTGIAFADTYPAELVNVSPLSPPVANSCDGNVTAAAGGSSISLNGGSLAAGATCSVVVTVTATTPGDYTNTSGAVSDVVAGSGNSTSDTLTVETQHPAIGLQKLISTSATGPWFTFVIVPPGTLLYYRFTAENTGDVTLATFNVTDPALAGTGADPAGCVWETTNVPSTLPTLPVATATTDPTATCVVGPIVALSGDNANTATAHGVFGGGTVDSSPSTAQYLAVTPGFDLLKQIATAPGGPWSSAITVSAGTSVYYKFTLVNTGGLDLSGISVTDPLVSTASCTFTDPLVVGAATFCVVGPVAASGVAGSRTTNTAIGHGSNSGNTFDTPPSSASYTISTPSADLAITKTDGVSTATPGALVTYTIVASNAFGPSAVTGATVTDPLPASLTGATWTCVGASGGTCPASGSGDISATVDLPVGGSVTFTLTATLSPAATGTLTNTASIAAPAGVTDPTPGNNSATDTDTITPIADLSITKTDGVSTATPGALVTYTIVASNAGPSAVTGATVTDTLPASLTGATWTCVGAGGGTCTASGSGNIADTVNLPVGGTVTYTLTAMLSASATGTLVNTATIAPPAGVTDPVPGNNASTDTDTITPTADLSITKTDGATTATPGALVTYTIVASNAGPSVVTGATVTDTLPASLTGATWTCVGAGGGTCTASGSGNISATVNLPVGGSVTFTLIATLSPAATGTLTNTATVSAPAGVTDPTPGNNSATDTDTITPTADLSITKTDGATTATPGALVTYTIVASNAGPSVVTGATVTDTLPASLTGATWTCVGAGGGTCTASGSGNISATVNLPVGGSVTFTLIATLSPAATGTLTNTATVSAPAGVTDPTPGNNSATDTDTITPTADLSITKTDGATTATPGALVTYTIVASNAGPSAVTGATVTDTLPASLTGATWTCVGAGGGTCTASGSGNISATVNLPVGGSVTFTLIATLSPAATGTLTNTATVSAPAGVTDPTPGNNSATDTDTITPTADLSITKTDGATTATPGALVTYTIVASNAGPSVVTGATVTDTLPASLTGATWTCVGAGGGTCTASGSGNISATVNLPVGGSVTFTLIATLSPAATGTLTNTATVSAPAGVTDPTPGNNSATDTDTITPTADLSITKTDGATTATPGALVTYTIVASNAGPSVVTGATVTDTLPASLTGATWTCVGAGGGTCTASGSGNISATVNLPVGGSVTFTLIATLSPAATGTLTNTATVSAPAGVTDPTPGNNSATDTDTITPTADLSITKTDGVSSVSAGGSTTYTITVSNAGPSEVTTATVVDTAPAGLTFGAWTCAVSDPGSSGSVITACGAASGSGNLNTTVTMKVGAVIVYTVPATVAAGATGSLANTATVTPPAGVTDPNPANNSATDTDTVSAVADLSITKTSADGSVAPGGSTTYTIRVSNAGPGEVVNATVVDMAPAGLTFGGWGCAVSNPGSGGSVTTACSASSGSGNLNTTVTMKAGAVIVYTVSATVAGHATGSIANTATVTPPQGVLDPTPANNSGTSTLSISASTPVPVLDEWALAVLIMFLCAVAAHSMRLARHRKGIDE